MKYQVVDLFIIELCGAASTFQVLIYISIGIFLGLCNDRLYVGTIRFDSVEDDVTYELSALCCVDMRLSTHIVMVYGFYEL